jgi:hypothetical protein
LPLFRINREHGLKIDRSTAMSRWIGDRMDYGWTTAVLCRDDGVGPRTVGERSRGEREAPSRSERPSGR